MIRVICPNCGSKLNAKDELAGQTRKCPKCAQPVRVIAAPPPSVSGREPAAAEPHVQPAPDGGLSLPDLPDHLNRQYHYLICDRLRLIATWENNGNGWMIKTAAGLVSVKRNYDQLPTEGDFKLVELKFTMTPEGKRLEGIRSYQLAQRWALNALKESDEAIIGKIVQNGFLNQDQKNVVRQTLREQFMRPVWENATSVLEYLGNTDYHTAGVG
jgi:hypothetical protein